MESETAAREIAEAAGHAVLIEAPAGCGKTYTIAQAVTLSKDGVQLVLTHTNAGVASLREKLHQFGVASKNCHVDTIDGWAQRIASYFPSRSGFHAEMSWPEKRAAALRLLDHHFACRLVQASHAGVYVDEYQDCSLAQHHLVLRLSELLPCRILGDPLQGVFDFVRDDPVVDWEHDVLSSFTKLGVLNEPWRWKAKGANQKLGEWLMSIRDDLVANRPIDLTGTPILWEATTAENEIITCRKKLRESGSIVVIHKLAAGAHRLAARLGGTYQSMEEMECSALLAFAHGVSVSDGRKRALSLVDAIEKCFVHPTETFDLSTIRTKLESGKVLKTKSTQPNFAKATEALASIVDDDSLTRVRDVISAIEKMPGAKLSRRELWTEIQRTLDSYLESPSRFVDLAEAATHVRGQTRMVGRRPERHTVSRVLLVKGLEFDHTIVTNADSFTAKELYVALSRGKRSVTVLSKNRIIRPVAPHAKKLKASGRTETQPTLLFPEE